MPILWPILWQYVLKNYLRTFALCICSFVAILLVLRFQEIALFASSGASLKHTLLFTFFQIPYILPIAIPVSSLIACLLLMQTMSHSQELTALRACGIPMRQIAYPLLLAAFFLSICNFTLTSEVTPLTRTLAKNLLYRIASANPLIVLQKDSAIELKTMDFDLKHLDVGKKAEDLICIFKQSSTGRLGLITAKELSVDQEHLYGKDLSVLSSADPQLDTYDHLIIENQKEMQIKKSSVTSHLLDTEWFTKEDLLCLKEVLLQCQQEERSVKPYLEILRRISLGFTPFTFTLIGLSFGMQ